MDSHHCACCKEKAQRIDAETQSDTMEKEVQPGKSHQKITRVIRKFKKNGEMVWNKRRTNVMTESWFDFT